jgi:amino acid transporter
VAGDGGAVGRLCSARRVLPCSDSRFSTAFKSVGLSGLADVIAVGAIIGILLAFVVVRAAVIVPRCRRPDPPRTFRTPWMPVVPAVGVVFSIRLTTFLQWQTWTRFAGRLAPGRAVCFAYSYPRSEPARR